MQKVNVVRGSGSERSDPPPTSVDGIGDKTNVSGKDPNFHYCWLDPRKLGTQLNGQIIPDGKHGGKRIAGYTRCKQETESAHWEGYRSVRDGASMVATDICNGELVLFKMPRADYAILRDYEEEQAVRMENRELDNPGDGRTMGSNLQHDRTIGRPMTSA